MHLTREIATPVQNSFFPCETLCLVYSYSFSGSCRREQEIPDDDHDLRSGAIVTVPSEGLDQSSGQTVQ